MACTGYDGEGVDFEAVIAGLSGTIVHLCYVLNRGSASFLVSPYHRFRNRS